MSVTSEGGPNGARPSSRQPSLFDLPLGAATVPPASTAAASDDEARAYAVDPRHNVVLEASAGTGKTSVLVSRYLNLLRAGVDPANILAITFTRKAAAEMRERIVGELRAAADRSEIDRVRWAALRDRLSDVAISTIDAFCLSLLREFPLEADVDPAFELADDTEVPALVATALDRTVRTLAAVARTDADVALVLAQLGMARTRQGLALLLDRRLVVEEVLDRFLARGPRDLTAAGVCLTAARRLRDALDRVPGGLPQFLADGPHGHPRYSLLLRAVHALRELPEPEPPGAAAIDRVSEPVLRGILERIAGHFLTLDGKARKAGAIPPYRSEHYPTRDAAKRHREAIFEAAPRVEEVMFAFSRDLNVVLARGVRRMFAVARAQYRQTLDERSILDFSDVLERALELLRRMDEFSQSRFRLESRYHHVLVDEFQDTSRAQWELVSLLVQAWGEGAGLAANPSIFVVGDRKQSIYRFRDADVSVLRQASAYIDGLRPGSRSRRAITRSFRAVPELQCFVNDLFSEISQPAGRADEFTYDGRDRFPIEAAVRDVAAPPALGLAVASAPDACAAAVADEIVALLHDSTIRDRITTVARQTRAGDIAILFRSRSSHREFERALGARGVPTYVYKGLGFFDADEVKDLTALLRYLADPSSPLRTAAFLRSRFVRLSDRGLSELASGLPAVLLSDEPPQALGRLDDEDRRVVELVRRHVPGWLAAADRITPAELLDTILAESAYAWELRGLRQPQAWENVKKLRGLVRRIQNRGYPTIRRMAGRLMSLSAGDESNAVIEALDAVNLMTVHASKGLEFPVVFVVNLAKGASGAPPPVRVVSGGAAPGADEPSVTIGPFLSETDQAERERELHESRRLLYVALTRARDRLYLASTSKDDALAAGRGSLAEVLPGSLAAFLAARRPPGADTATWTSASGTSYTWRLCRAVDPPPQAPAHRAASCERGGDFFEPLVAAGSHVRLGARDASAGVEDASMSDGAPADRLLGVLVHRLFQSAAVLEGDEGAAAVAAAARRLLRPEDQAGLEGQDDVALTAAERWLRARTRADVMSAFAGERRHEVPFSLLLGGPPPLLVRGVIDCLVHKPDGTILVVELKTGRPHPAHERQLELYVRAARALHSGAPVGGVLLYV